MTGRIKTGVKCSRASPISRASPSPRPGDTRRRDDNDGVVSGLDQRAILHRGKRTAITETSCRKLRDPLSIVRDRARNRTLHRPPAAADLRNDQINEGFPLLEKARINNHPPTSAHDASSRILIISG